MSNRPIMPIMYANNLATNEALTAYGHPGGTPLKLSFSAVMRGAVSTNEKFTHSLDIFGGNSGSGVLRTGGVLLGVVTNGFGYKKATNTDGTDCATPVVCANPAACTEAPPPPPNASTKSANTSRYSRRELTRWWRRCFDACLGCA